MGRSSRGGRKERRATEVVDLALWRDVRLAQRALAGDVEAQIRWLAKYGGPKYRAAAESMGHEIGAATRR